MKWKIEYSKQANKFAKQHELFSSVREEIHKFLLKMIGVTINLDVKRLKGNWEGFLRIRKGRLRIILTVDEQNKIIYIDKIDFRGSVYK